MIEKTPIRNIVAINHDHLAVPIAEASTGKRIDTDGLTLSPADALELEARYSDRVPSADRVEDADEYINSLPPLPTNEIDVIVQSSNEAAIEVHTAKSNGPRHLKVGGSVLSRLIGR